MKYTVVRARKRHWPRRLLVVGLVLVVFFVGATAFVRNRYNNDLRPVSASQSTKLVDIQSGDTVDTIGTLLQKDGLIRSAWAFKLYVTGKQIHNELQAGTYNLSPSQSLPEIVAQITHGKIATDLVTILPGQRLDQVRTTFLKDGFAPEDVDAALDPATYTGATALVDKPAGASLEGYLYPDSFQKNADTKPKEIVSQSLAEMAQHLTPQFRAAVAKQGLSTYQGIILASIVEKEVSSQSDRAQVAQVFLSRLAQHMTLGSDVTAYYGAIISGAKPTITYDTPYNTLIHTGLPPTPISNVDASALQAVMSPANTNWLYFVTGDNGVTYFSQTLQQHEQYTQQYCHKLCEQQN